MEEDEECGCCSNGTDTEDQETFNLKDWNDEEYNHNNPFKCSPGFTPKLQFRFFAERGALILLDANDTALSLTSIYEKVAKDKNECSWESFEVYRHLKSLGYIINRRGLPWTLKINTSCCNSKCLGDTLESDDTSKTNMEDETSSIICRLKDVRINEMMPNFDVYLPSSKFRKSAPGNPSFILLSS